MAARRVGLVLALALPVVGVVVGIARAEFWRARADEWTFATRGYDPRDLVRGHYVRFAIDFDEGGSADNCQRSDPSCCLCLTGKPGAAIPKVERMLCEEAKRCDGMLQTRLIEHLDRYYIPETRAREVQRRARSTDRVRVVLLIDAAGQAQVKELLLDGQRLE